MYVMRPKAGRDGAIRGPARVAGDLNAGYVMAAAMILGVGIGLWIDRAWHSAPWGLLGSLLLFLAVGMYHMVKAVGR